MITYLLFMTLITPNSAIGDVEMTLRGEFNSKEACEQAGLIIGEKEKELASLLRKKPSIEHRHACVAK
jgi:hypothetical protein